jgi:hypothetical protein
MSIKLYALAKVEKLQRAWTKYCADLRAEILKIQNQGSAWDSASLQAQAINR